MRNLVLTISLLICYVISFSLLSQTYAQDGAVSGHVYVRDYMGDYRLTTEALVTATDGVSTFTANYPDSYFYLSLHPGDWRITCTLSGYVSQSIDISLSEGGSVSLNFYLQQSDEPHPDPKEIEPATVGGLVTPVNKLEILTPYIALAGLIAAVSTVYIIRRRKD